MEETSLQAWAYLKATGILNVRQTQVLTALREAKTQMTAKELGQYMKTNGYPDDGAWKRMSELYKKGVVKKCGTAKCTVSGLTAIRWAVDLSKGLKKKSVNMVGV